MALNNPYSLKFNGHDSYVLIPYTSKNNPVNSITVMATAHNNNWSSIGKKNIICNFQNGGYGIVCNDTNTGIGMVIYNNNSYKNASVKLNTLTNGWHTFIGVYDGNNIIFYVDGYQVAKTTCSGNIKYSYNTPLCLGANPKFPRGVDYGYWNGLIDNISIWNKALSQKEINYYMNRRLGGDEKSLVGYWTLDEGKGNTTHDLTSNQNHGTIHNTEWTEGEIDLQSYINISNMNISKTNIWYTDKNSISLSCLITHSDNKNIKYEILVNNIKAVELDNFIFTPASINIDIPIDLFTKEKNLLKLTVSDDGGRKTNFKYNIIKENKNTFTFKRIFDFKENYIKDENIKVIYQKGLALNSVENGLINIDIPTEDKSKIKNITINGTDNQNKAPIIPVLSSNKQDGYEVNASSSWNNDYQPWKAFNGTNMSAEDCWASSSATMPQWIQIKLPYEQCITKYSITSRYSRYNNPLKSWKLEGSSNGINWTILDEQINVPMWKYNETREYKITKNFNSYLYYRIYIIKKYNSQNYVEIGELQLYKTGLDTTEEIKIDNPMIYLKDLGAGKVYKNKLLTKYNNITNIEIE